MIVIDLPLPPSTNDIWTSDYRGGVMRSKKYKAWLRHAGQEFIVWKAQHRIRTIDPLEGPFCALILFADTARGDVDNRVKPLLDFAQHVRLIVNDSQCRFGAFTWAKVPGCRLFLEPGKKPTQLLTVLSAAFAKMPPE